MNNKLKSLLYRSFDETLNEEDQNRLTKALSQSETLRIEKDTILQIRRSIKAGKVTAFNSFFAERVMNRIGALRKEKIEDSFFESLIIIFRPVAIAAIVLIIFVAAYNIRSSGQISIEGALAVPEVTLDDAYASSLAIVIEEE